MRARAKLRHLNPRTEQAYLGWERRYVRHCGDRHPRDLGDKEVGGFLASLAVDRQVSAFTQNQALAALHFLYREVLGIPIAVGEHVVRAKRERRLPEVMTRSEVAAVITGMDGIPRLVVRLSMVQGCASRNVCPCASRISDSRSGVGLAVGLPGEAALCGTGHRDHPA